jgi:GxxExxY protein
MNSPGDHADPQTYSLIGAAMEVHSHLGSGFLEAVYQEALCRELRGRGIKFHAEVALPIYFKGERLTTSYRADLICYDRVLIELKALRSIGGAEISQVINYLKASKLTIALLINFGAARLQYRRFVL